MSPDVVPSFAGLAADLIRELTRNPWLLVVRPGLQDALLTVAGRAGHINARALGKWLLKHAGRVVDLAGHGELPLPLAFEAAGDRQGVVLWRIAERGL
jgi:hypothetical protein